VPPGEFVRATSVMAGGAVAAPVLRAVAHVDSWVAVIGTSLLATVLARLPGEHLVQVMAYSCNSLASRLVDHGRMALLRLGDRLLLEFGTLAQDFGRSVTGGVLIDVRLTHAQLASLVGGSRAAVCRALGALVSRGLLVVQGEYFVLPDAPVRRLPVTTRAQPVRPMHVPAFAPLPLS
jgi:CRP-like cAMP-binding protein